MGWWWSAAPKPEQQQQQQQQQIPTPQSPDASPLPSSPSNSAPPPKPETLSRDERADAELKQLLASFEEAEKDLKNSTPQTSGESSASSTPQPHSIAPESLYPDTMSCRSAFDYAFFCQSFGGQFVNVYRYGELRSCSEHWDNFWLCMKSRAYSEERRKQVIRDHNRKKAIKYKTGPSSEDIWDVRTEPVRDAFSGDFAALEAEMKAAEEARMKATAK